MTRARQWHHVFFSIWHTLIWPRSSKVLFQFLCVAGNPDCHCHFPKSEGIHIVVLFQEACPDSPCTSSSWYIADLPCSAATNDKDINDIFGKGGSHGSQSNTSDAQTFQGSITNSKQTGGQSGAQSGGQTGRTGGGQSQAQSGKQGGAQSGGHTPAKTTSKLASEGSSGTSRGQGNRHPSTYLLKGQSFRI